MRLPEPQIDWSDDWKALYNYDLMQYFKKDTKCFLETPLFPKRTPKEAESSYFAYQRRLKKTIDILLKYLKPPASVLDLGAAEGNFSLLLAQDGYQVTWNDYIASREGYVRLKITDEIIDFCPGNAFELQFSRKFDGVLATEIIEHVAHPDEFLVNAARLAKRGGIVVLSTPNGNYLRNKLLRFSDFNAAALTTFEKNQFKPDGDGHIFALYRDEIEQICRRNSLKIECIEYDIPPAKLASMPLYNLIPKVPYLNRWLCNCTIFVCRVT